ncbi:GNAT family N-acetyltransferase [Streptomyces sp. NPDC052095]|uniref:GNAT family N-acetyltransferase n=1 Tax=unclassified Streptomyces TaxID=2593676 RepID=UPI00344E07C6
MSKHPFSVGLLLLHGRNAIEDFYLPYRQALARERPSDPPACRTAFLGQMKHPRPGSSVLAWGARVNGRPIGLCAVGISDSEDSADIVHFYVHPEARRTGVGTALFREAARHLTKNGLRKVSAFTTSSEAGSSSGDAFAEAIGFVCRLRYKRLSLQLREASSTPAEQTASGYQILNWRSGVPGEHRAAFAEMSSRLAEEEAARSDSSRPHEDFDGEKIDALYRSLRTWGYRTYLSTVRHVASNELVGYSSLGLADSHRRHASQWDTIVFPSHRGHALGTILKQANLSWARQYEPELATVTTWNAVGNNAMLHVNESFGFRGDACGAVWELDLP